MMRDYKGFVQEILVENRKGHRIRDTSDRTPKDWVSAVAVNGVLVLLSNPEVLISRIQTLAVNKVHASPKWPVFDRAFLWKEGDDMCG